MIKNIIAVLALSLSIKASAGNKIVYYFNHPVDNSVAAGTNAVFLNNCVGDTLVAYINRSKYTLDIAMYNYTSTQPAIAAAVNNAHARGVKVRWIYDGSQSNTGLPLLNSGINKLSSPTTSAYTIMHNKFMLVDAQSSDPNDAIVWTGSSNWNTQQFNYDYNNYVIIQDSALAHAYHAEFNMMWGGSGLSPDISLAKFGQYKTDLGRHDFTIDGKHIELYFSPSDGTNSHIQSTIATADKDMYFGMFTFTYNANATMLVDKRNVGVNVAGIEDVSSNTSTPFGILSSGLGSANFKTYDGPGNNIYHNKFVIVDPSDACSDPMVLTGSHNWSFNADTKNDENTLIIHDATAANIYYQSFRSDFAAMGGSLATVTGCSTSGASLISLPEQSVHIYPNPANGAFTLSYELNVPQAVTIGIYNITGSRVTDIAADERMAQGLHKHNININKAGLYFIKLTIGGQVIMRKVIIN